MISFQFEKGKLTKTKNLEDSSQVPNYSKGITIMLFVPKEKGQGLVEYAIILALVAIVVIAVMQILGPKIGNTFSSINASMDTF